MPQKILALLLCLSLPQLYGSFYDVSHLKRNTPAPPSLLEQPIAWKGNTWYLSASAKISGDGSRGRPFNAIQDALTHLKPSDTLIMMDGVYRNPIDLKGVKGPLRIQSETPHGAVLKGTMPIDRIAKGQWKKEGEIYSIQLKRDIHQLFQNDVNMTLARWPNAQEFSESMWDMPATWRHQHSSSTFGLMVDERPGGSKKGKVSGDEGNIDHIVADDVNTESLADTGVDFTGATAVMNIGSWLSWAQTIEQHKAGSDRFHYSKDFSKSGKVMAKSARNFLNNETFFNTKKYQGHYYIVGKACLDQELEWWYDRPSSTLYLIPPAGKHPSSMNLEGKVHAFNMEAVSIAGLTIEGLKFFGTTFNILNGVQTHIDNCHFLYPSYNRLTLGDFTPPEAKEVSTLETILSVKSKNRISDCHFEKMDGPVLWISGREDVIENNTMQEIDFTVLGYGGGGTLTAVQSIDLLFTRNTLHTAGCSEGYRLGNSNEVSYNHIFNTGLLQHDGSAINAGLKSQKGSYIHHNWVHDTAKQGIRLDAVSKGNQHLSNSKLWYGTGSELSHNVVWNVQMNQNKGDEHLLYNSIYFNGRKSHFGIILSHRMGGINEKTEVYNILTPRIDSVWWGKISERPPVPGKVITTIEDEVQPYLRGTHYYDFRPKAGSALIDAGTNIARRQIPYHGKALDIGAYEHGDLNYWIPGAQSKIAQTPIPKDGATKVANTASLMWLQAKVGVQQHVHVAKSREACLASIEPHQTLAMEHNIVNLNLKPGETVFWRVSTQRQDGSFETSPIWSFEVSP